MQQVIINNLVVDLEKLDKDFMAYNIQGTCRTIKSFSLSKHNFFQPPTYVHAMCCDLDRVFTHAKKHIQRKFFDFDLKVDCQIISSTML